MAYIHAAHWFSTPRALQLGHVQMALTDESTLVVAVVIGKAGPRVASGNIGTVCQAVVDVQLVLTDESTFTGFAAMR